SRLCCGAGQPRPITAVCAFTAHFGIRARQNRRGALTRRRPHGCRLRSRCRLLRRRHQMSTIDTETRRKLRDMAAGPLLDALPAQDDTLTLGMSFEQRIQLAVDEAHSAFTHAKVDGLIRRAQLRYPNADLRR